MTKLTRKPDGTYEGTIAGRAAEVKKTRLGWEVRLSGVLYARSAISRKGAVAITEQKLAAAAS